MEIENLLLSNSGGGAAGEERDKCLEEDAHKLGRRDRDKCKEVERG